MVGVGEIRERAASLGQTPRGLVFLMVDGSLDVAIWFHALLEARRPVALIDSANEWETVAELFERYRPDMVIDPGLTHLSDLLATPIGMGGQVESPGVWTCTVPGPEPHPDLAVLLTTSGSTGSPKLVRLSAANIRANARQIVSSLGIRADDRGATLLPLFYSFGMSILTSHALASSTVVVTSGSVLDPPFWAQVEEHGVTFLPGVPTTYAWLKRLGFASRELPRLRALIQAGGRLSPELISYFHDVMTARGGQFFVMYGQTEASPRISCLPSDRLPEKLGSVGPALEGGTLRIAREDGTEADALEVGEVYYQGPNVMMGYAETRDDLALGDTHGGELATGDLGYLDAEGFLYLTGRSKRICKLAGSRVSLDDIEAMAARLWGGAGQVAAVAADDDGVSLFVTHIGEEESAALRLDLARHLRVPPKLIGLDAIDSIPLLPTGKRDYQALVRTAGMRKA